MVLICDCSLPAGAWYHLSLFLDDMQLNFAFACVLAGAATAQVRPPSRLLVCNSGRLKFE